MNTKKIKKILQLIPEFVLLLLLMLCLSMSGLVLYGIRQLKGQMSIILEARPVEDILNDASYPDSVKQKLFLIQEIKKFAADSLGINPSNNYTTFYDQKNKPVLWVLTAAEPYALKAKNWKFPVIGSVSYKGFFDKKIGEKEELELKTLGFDTELGRVNAWSTLGWFRDPILSNQLTYSEGGLAELIIHELTHGTLYVKSNVDFNENLASFIGNKGAIRFLEYKYGKDSKEYFIYMNDKADEVIFNNYILQSALVLDSLYRTFNDATKKTLKEKKKNITIEKIVSNVKALSINDTAKYHRYIKKALTSKNTFFMSFVRYDSQQEIFEKEFSEKFNSDIRKYLLYLKQKYPSSI